jgi:DNA-binding HxlR family transcriptional regulator
MMQKYLPLVTKGKQLPECRRLPLGSQVMNKKENVNKQDDCLSMMMAVRDTLDVINGKWKIMILISLRHGYNRFREIERSIPKISSKVLAKELKDLEEHQLIKRTVNDGYPVLVEYALTPYAQTLEKVMKELHAWGLSHRRKIFGKTDKTK